RIQCIATSSSVVPDKCVTKGKRSAPERTGKLFLRPTATILAPGTDNKSRSVMLPFALRHIQTATERPVSIPDWHPATASSDISDIALLDWLRSAGSLTQRLKAAGCDDFRVEVLDEQQQPARADQAA